MTREELINNCRYYTGDETADKERINKLEHVDRQNVEMFWFYESKYVEFGLSGDDHIYKNYEREYTCHKGKYKWYDSIPKEILLILYNRWGHWGRFYYYTKEEFENFYSLIENQYLEYATDKYPKDKLPNSLGLNK